MYFLPAKYFFASEKKNWSSRWHGQMWIIIPFKIVLLANQDLPNFPDFSLTVKTKSEYCNIAGGLFDKFVIIFLWEAVPLLCNDVEIVAGAGVSEDCGACSGIIITVAEALAAEKLEEGLLEAAADADAGAVGGEELGEFSFVDDALEAAMIIALASQTRNN